MAKRYKNFRDGSSNSPYPDEWGDMNEDRAREKAKKKGTKYSRRNRREEKFQNYWDWRDK